MLAPERSVTLLEVLEPPDGYQLDVAVGTSYTLDLQALLALPTAFALHHTPTRDAARADTTPLELLEALRAHAGAITVFTDAGHIKLPPTAGAGVFGFLEESVVPVTAPGGGAFHPKVWAIRFVDDDGAFLHRLLVASRNLTFDRSWDTMVRLDEDADGEDLPGVTDLLDGLLTLGDTSGQLTPHRREAVQDLTRSLTSARFAPPEGFTSLRLHTLGLPEATERWPFPADSRRSLVVSPFLSASAMERLRRETRQLTVVSRVDELDHAYATITTAHPIAYEVNPNLVDPDEGAAELSGLHAKVFVFDTPGSTTHVFTGSANATTAAFSRNVEVTLELTGPTRGVGVNRWLDESSPSLRSILMPHTWGTPPDG
ncbi:phospholipase D family protein, partial [Georgenia sp. 10Sc9-8]|nr:phospholipase D family protein [Georgenia halotolerans]